MRGRQRAFAADRDQHVDAVVVECLLDLVQPRAQLVGVDPSGAEHRAALGQQAVVALVVGQLDPPVLEQPAPPVLEADDGRAVPGVARAYHRPDHRVQAGTVATAGEYSDPHGFIMPRGHGFRGSPVYSVQNSELAGQIAVGSGPRAAS